MSQRRARRAPSRRGLGAHRPLAAAIVVAAVAVLIATAVATLALRWIPPPTSAIMLQYRAQALRAERPDRRVHYRWVGWEGISPHLAIAVIAAEDQKFAGHAGFDLESIAQAVRHDDRDGRLRGASTISQQVAKNLFLWSGRNFLRKGLEACFAALIELSWPKRRILEVYLNVAEFGEGIFGVSVASQRFFRKAPQQLTLEEAALLAAVLPNPRRLRVDEPSPYVRERAAWIVEQVELLGGVAYLGAL